jgi:hypothetical protein
MHQSEASPFDNGEASDWAYELLDKDPPNFIRDTLEEVTKVNPGGYVLAPYCSMAIAAAEVVAAIHGKGLKPLPADVEAWLTSKPNLDPQLKALALDALKRIGENSELKEQWDEASSEGTKAWYAHLADLTSRLR